MEKGLYSEEALRRFFGKIINDLGEDEKIGIFNLLVEHFSDAEKELEWPDSILFSNKEIDSEYFIVGQGPQHRRVLSADEEAATQKYLWSELLSRRASKEVESIKINEINNSIDFLKATIERANYKQQDVLIKMGAKLDEVAARTRTLSVEMHEKYIPRSFGIDPSEYPLSRYLPIRIYLSEHPNEKIPEIISFLGDFIDSMGFLFVDEFPSKKGSWWKSWFGKSKDVITSDEFVDRLKKGERAIELATLDKAQSEVNKNNSEAAANLIGSLADIDNAALQVGSLLVVKVTSGNTSSIHTRQLTNREMILLEKNQSLLHKPTVIIEKLEQLSCDDVA